MGLLGRVISPSQGTYLHKEDSTKTEYTHTDIHTWDGIRTYDLSVRTGEESSCLRQRRHCDRLASERTKTVNTLDSAATVTG
jgi:hypothetical protein